MMAKKAHLQYGQWPSRITPQNIGGMLDLSEPAWNRKGDLFWRESSSGRGSIMRMPAQGNEIQQLSGDYQVGGGLLYGGGSFGVDEQDVVFIDKSTQQLVRSSIQDIKPTPLTADLIR